MTASSTSQAADISFNTQLGHSFKHPLQLLSKHCTNVRFPRAIPVSNASLPHNLGTLWQYLKASKATHF